VARNRAVLNLGRALSDGDGIDDLAYLPPWRPQTAPSRTLKVRNSAIGEELDFTRPESLPPAGNEKTSAAGGVRERGSGQGAFRSLIG